MTICDLTQLPWQVQGWRPFAWLMHNPVEIAAPFHPDIGPLPVTIPGSAHGALRAAGQLKDWNVGLQSLECEWVEHRHWEFFTEIPAVPAGQTAELRADGLDYSGWIRVDGKTVQTFSGALHRHRCDLSAQLADGKAHRLSIVFDIPPEEQGQIGFSSRSRHFKSRYNFSWDWCPRLVPTGIWEPVQLVIGDCPAEVIGLRAELDPNNSTGEIHARMHCQIGATVRLRVLDANREIAATERALPAGEHDLKLRVDRVEPWWPNGMGTQKLYQVQIGDKSFTVGFKRVRWLPCEGAAANALPWICEVNGRPLFLQGVNWTPVRLDYPSVTAAEYAHLVDLYRKMGCNLFRVWGGAFLERAEFYDQCDRAGILVWQEFPLSSSGPDNNAPEDPAVIETLCDIARDYIRRRGHHACKLLWCGGNELQVAPGKKDGGGLPLDNSHPCLGALAQVVEQEDPGTRFLPTSASGPRFLAHAKDFGKGIHHDVHGPWKLPGTLAEWEDYWSRDDALFRSETGCPGAAAVSLIEQFRGPHDMQPHAPTNRYLLHTAIWWLQTELADGKSLAEYVAASQKLQARALEIAARACKSRFPRCGGFLVWMGHDCFPCPINTAIIDFAGNPKPAYHALAKVFRSTP